MKIEGIVLGEGYLGKRISKELEYPCFGRKAINPLNINKFYSFLEDVKPEVVINAIGKTGRPNIDWCEDNKEETILSNIGVPTILGSICSEKRIYFIHLGSGCIYSGDNEGKGFKESDEPNFYGPQFYAKTKILAEKIIKETSGLILRIRMPVDEIPHERNLIDKLVKYRKVIDIPNSITTVPHMIGAIKKFIEKRAQGVYNLVNPGAISAKEIMEMYREIIDPSHKFDIFNVNELDKITKGKRSNCILNTDKLKKEEIILPEIHEAVRYCLLNYKRRSEGEFIK